MSTPAPHAPAPLTDPGQLVANLPAILGFYPAESVLALILSHTGDKQYQLGPTLRVDLEDVEHLAEPLPEIVEPTDVVLILIVSDDHEVEDALETITAHAGHLIEGVWHCREISEGESLRLLHGPAVPDLDEWHHTTIPAIHQAVATRDVLRRGGHVSLDRQEAHEAFQPVPLSPDMSRVLSEVVAAVETRLRTISETAEGEVQSLIADLRAGLEGTPTDATHRDIDPGVLALTCALLSADELDIRDLALGELIRCPRAGAAVGHAVGVYGQDALTRATGLTAHALTVMAATGPAPVVQAALRIAHETAPLHGLTSLIHGAVTGGAPHAHVVQCVVSGVEILRQRYGLSD